MNSRYNLEYLPKVPPHPKITHQNKGLYITHMSCDGKPTLSNTLISRPCPELLLCAKATHASIPHARKTTGLSGKGPLRSAAPEHAGFTRGINPDL